MFGVAWPPQQACPATPLTGRVVRLDDLLDFARTDAGRADVAGLGFAVQFNGNPLQLMLAGESAGALAICHILAAPEAAGRMDNATTAQSTLRLNEPSTTTVEAFRTALA